MQHSRCPQVSLQLTLRIPRCQHQAAQGRMQPSRCRQLSLQALSHQSLLLQTHETLARARQQSRRRPLPPRDCALTLMTARWRIVLLPQRLMRCLIARCLRNPTGMGRRPRPTQSAWSSPCKRQPLAAQRPSHSPSKTTCAAGWNVKPASLTQLAQGRTRNSSTRIGVSYLTGCRTKL